MEQRFSKLLLVRNRNSMIVLAPNQARVLSLQTLADMQKHNSTHITYFTHHLFFIGWIAMMTHTIVCLGLPHRHSLRAQVIAVG